MLLRIFLFGTPQFENEGQSVPLSRRKATAIMAYLAVTGQPQNRDSLATLYWPDQDQSGARANLRRDLSYLRRELGEDVLTVNRAQAAVLPGAVWLDIAEFQAKVTLPHDHAEGELCADCVADLTTAVSLHTADFMAGFSLTDCPEFDEWQFFQRESYRQLLAGALQKLIGWYSGQHAWEEGVGYGRQWLLLDPLHEPAQRELMKLYAWAGQQAAALRQYLECEQILQDELGVAPQPETTALYEAIRTRQLALPVMVTAVSEPLSPSTTPYTLPSDTTPFFGRQQEVARIQQMLDKPECRLLTIIGLGGMGKSRLALEAARQMEAFAHGAVFVVLAGVSTTAALPDALAESLHITLSGSGDPLVQLLNFLADKRLLLVLDNFEHLLTADQPQDAGDFINRLLRQCPDVKLLVTSRESLRLEAEWRLNLDGLPYPQTAESITAQDALHYEAVQLFAQAAVQSQPDFTLTDAEAATVSRICQFAAGMPLAVKLAATWLRAISLERIVVEMERSLNILVTRLRDLPARQRSMRAIFDYSWDLLIEPERELFQSVSVFRGGFTEEAAQDVAESSPFLLAGLVDQGLLQVAETADGLRYQMHELTRQYAAERLANSQMAVRIVANHARYFADFVAAQNESLRCDGFNMAAHTIVTELNNVNAAWSWLLQGVAEGQPSDLAVKLLPQFPPGLQYYYYLKGPLQTGKQTFLQAVTICETAGWDAQPSEHGGHYVLALCRTCAAFFALGMGEYDLVDELLGKAMGWWRQNGRADELGFALCTAGKTSLLRGQRGAAEEILHEALALMQEAGDLNGKADVLKVLGVVAVDRGHYEEAIAYYQESLALFERIDFKPGMTMVLHNIGTALFRQDKLEEARASYERALTLAKEIEYRRIVMESSGAMGGVHRVLGQHDRAERYFRRAVSMAREMGEQRITSVNLRGLGMNYLATNKLAAAESTLQEAFTIGWRTENMPEALAGMITLAQTWAQQGRVADALQLAFYVSQQQATRAIDREKNEGFLSELRQELPALMVESAERWASEQTFDTVAAWALNDETLYEI